jgi:anti-sigma factor (TIGR02949 family)
MDCRQIESMLPPFLDGEGDAATDEKVRAHLAACPACAEQAAKSRAARDLLRACADSLREPAPPGLRTRILAHADAEARAFRPLGWPGRVSALGAAAAIVLAVIGLFELVPMRPAVLYAAQVAFDHWRCLYVEAGTIRGESPALEREIAAQFGREVRVPPSDPERGLMLIGARRCPLKVGPHTHLLYRAGDRHVSLYITPGAERGDHELRSLGQTERLWSGHGRTYALVARDVSPADLDRIERYFRETAE